MSANNIYYVNHYRGVYPIWCVCKGGGDGYGYMCCSNWVIE